MSRVRQIFQTDSRLRWGSFVWISRFFLVGLILVIPLILLSLYKDYVPLLPKLKNEEFSFKKIAKPVSVKNLSTKEKRIYKGFDLYLAARRRNEALRGPQNEVSFDKKIRAGFLVSWDPSSVYTLQQNIDKLNMVFPEWLFIDPKADTLVAKVDTSTVALVRTHKVKILPILSNTDYTQKNGSFNGKSLQRIFHAPAKREALINSIVKTLKNYQFEGINIDFEELNEDGDEALTEFIQELHQQLKKAGLMLTQDIMADDKDFNIRELAKYNDYLVLMAYDEHNATSNPGTVSEQRWIERTVDVTAKEIPSSKIILGMAAYGYDWPESDEATPVTYEQALATAALYHQQITFDNDTYNNHYEYTDDTGVHHKVFFTDAATNFNVMRFADEYELAGTAIWRLGAEDQRLWSFYNRDLSDNALVRSSFDYSVLQRIALTTTRPDYIGDGEIMDVAAIPQQGIIETEVDSSEKLVTEEYYKQLPTNYLIRKYGEVNNQVVLTFDDGPDPEFTPRILDILKKEKIKAAFFVIGVNGEANLPLLKRIVREGHDIGNHTFTHPNMAMVTNTRAKSELEATRLLIEAVTGRSTILYRVPYNADSEPSTPEELKPLAFGKDFHYYTVGESIDPLDWEKNTSPDTIFQRIVAKYEANPGKGIILLHDGGGDREATVQALPRIIAYFKQKGVQFITVEQLLGKTREELMPVVNSDLTKMDSRVFEFFYWIERFVLSAFWIAIFLFLGKIIMMATLATIQQRRGKKEQLMLAALSKKNPIQEKVSIVVPAYNEELNAVSTIHSLLSQTYKNIEIIFIDDGSKDKTLERVRTSFAGHAQVTIVSKQNGGKASALNEGIKIATGSHVVCIDADTQLRTDAVEKLMSYFGDSHNVAAVAGNVKVGNKETLLTKWQHIEYTTAQNFDRHAFDLVNGITVVPGAIGAFKRSAILEVGGFTSDTLAEDCDLTIRLLRNGYVVRNCPQAIAITEAPENVSQFMKQRFRWNYGVMQSFWKHRDACFNPKYKALGLISLPNILIYQIVLPFLAPLADLMMIISMIWNWNNPASMEKILIYYFLFIVVDVLFSAMAFLFEKEKLKDLIWLVPQRFVYRQLMYIVLIRSLLKAIKGETQTWGNLKRTGNVQRVLELETKEGEGSTFIIELPIK